MINDRYAKAYAEVLEIISYFPEEEYNKIPKEDIEFYKNNRDKNYKFTIDPEVDLAEQNISKEASAVILTMFRDYFATEDQKQKLKELIVLNEKKLYLEKREKYNFDSLFTNRISNENTLENQKNRTVETSLIEYKENFFNKFKNFILRLLHIKN